MEDAHEQQAEALKAVEDILRADKDLLGLFREIQSDQFDDAVGLVLAIGRLTDRQRDALRLGVTLPDDKRELISGMLQLLWPPDLNGH